MVEILCPHCEEEIEIEDDASGEFACPHCDGEFEWNVDAPAEEADTDMYGPPVGGGAALRWTMGLIIAIVGFSIILISLFGLFIGSELSEFDSELEADTGIGAGVIFFSFLIGAFGLACAVAGIGAIRRNFAAFVACTVLSALGGINGIVQLIFDGVNADSIFGFLFWGAMVAGHFFVMFTPRGRMMWME
jgi:hypothetical protein